MRFCPECKAMNVDYDVPLYRSRGGITCACGHGGVVADSEAAKDLPWHPDELPRATIMLDGGKYEFVVQCDGVVSCLRNGEQWIEQFGEGTNALIALIEAAKRPHQVTDGAALQGIQTLTVSYPRQEMYPIKFHGFEVGGISITVQVSAGGDVQAAYDAAWLQLKAMSDKQFEAVLADYIARVRFAASAIERDRREARDACTQDAPYAP